MERSDASNEDRGPSRWIAGELLRATSFLAAAPCVSCGRIAPLHPEPLFTGVPICDECASHVHPGEAKSPWIGNAT